jgi:hypothetical protein
MKRTFLTLILAGTVVAVTGLAQEPEVGERKENQQDRIANGVKNGSLTPHETQKLEKKEAKINRETRRDRRQNGGPLTPAERAKINHQQNKVSKDIYHEKHDSEHQ